MFAQQSPGCPEFLKVLISFKAFVIVVDSEIFIHVLSLNGHSINVVLTLKGRLVTSSLLYLYLVLFKTVPNSKYYPCTFARNICPATGCILQYKCHLGNIWGGLQGSLPGHEAERNASCLKQVSVSHTNIPISGTEKGFPCARKERERECFQGIKWSFESVYLCLWGLNIFGFT